MVHELLDGLRGIEGKFAPSAPARDRAFWDGLPERVRSELIGRAESLGDFEYPSLPASLYMNFKRTGNRVLYEDRYFARRRALGAFALAECVLDDGSFLDRVIDGIDAIAGEAGWQIPAHNGYIRDAPQLILPDDSAPVLDLFACETGALLALIRYLLGDRLEAVSPMIPARIGRLLESRIIRPYLERHFWWMGDGDEPMCNWTPWCTQNALIVAALTDRTEAELRRFVEKAAYSLDCFLKDYGDDGCCSEGAQYYRHAGLCLFGSIEILESLAPGAFAPLWRNAKIRNIARYICDVHVDDRYYVNFADCSPLAGRAGVREYLFGKRVGADDLVRFAVDDWVRAGAPTLPEEINLFYRLLAVSNAREISASADFARSESAADLACAHDAWYPSIGLFIARSGRICLAVKAGGNGDSHNHNDTGSFILYRDGGPCIIDVGVESYTAKTFSPRRYEIWTMQSAWHNLPTFGDCMQSDGAEYCARDVAVERGSERAAISMELSGAWKPECGVRSFSRTVALDKESGSVSIDDACDSDRAPVLSLMTALEPSVSGGCSISVGGLATIEVSGLSGPVSVERVDLTDARLWEAWGERVWRIRIPFGRRLSLLVK